MGPQKEQIRKGDFALRLAARDQNPDKTLDRRHTLAARLL
jgi:hypothetical protein